MQADPIDDCLANLIAEGFGSTTAETDAAWLRGRLLEAGYRIELDPNQLLEKGEKLFKPVRSA